MARQDAAADKTPNRLVRGTVRRGCRPAIPAMTRAFVGMGAAARRLHGLDRRHPSSALHQHVRRTAPQGRGDAVLIRASAEEILLALKGTKTPRVFARMRRQSEFSTKGGSK